MALTIYTSDRTSPRCFPWLWFVRLLQLLVTIIVLAIAASNASELSSIDCSVPSKLGYNIAAAVLSFIVLVILILSTGPKPGLRVIPWFIWGQLALDAFMFIIWIAAAGVSRYNCNDLCSACSGYNHVWADGLDCLCYYYYKRDQSPVPKGLARSIEERAYHRRGPGAGKVAGKTALNAIMVVLFAFTTAMTVFWIFKNRRSGAAASTATPLAPQPTPTPGAAPMTGTGPEKIDPPYTQPTLQGAYPQGPPQTQAPMQQTGYPEPMSNMQQPTYHTSGPQGSAEDYYNQSQNQPQQAHYPPNYAEMQSHSMEQPAVSPVAGH
ncbi:MAG: hypothetical protein Q9218_005955 [Villophora microphyllina]